jgi:very-short-patch-repair endonuclease
LVIEIDGITHEGKVEEDEKRQRELEDLGLRFLRFLDSDVRENLNGVLLRIIDWIEEKEHLEGSPP